MSNDRDLTRWNRSGLQRFRYVDGNAVTLFEKIRQLLIDRFSDPDSGELRWEALEEIRPEGEASQTENDLLLEQYRTESRDLGIELVRALARSTHVLTEHLDVYANESYLGTATQWEHVRRLVQMLDYHPSPPSSASTDLVLIAKKGKKGLVAKGLQVKNSPKDGASPAVFETLEDVKIDVDLNALRVSNWNISPTSLSATGTSPWIAKEDEDISSGDLAVLGKTSGALATAMKIKSRDRDGVLTLESLESGSAWQSWKLGEVQLEVGSKKVLKPRLNGTDVLQFDEGHGLVAGDLVAWEKNGWYFATVAESDAHALRLAGSSLPDDQAGLYRAYAVEADSSGDIRFPTTYKAVSSKKAGKADNLSSHTVQKISSSASDDFSTAYRKLAGTSLREIYLVGSGVKSVAKARKGTASGSYVFPGSPEGLASGQWLVAELKDGSRQAVRIKEIKKQESSFTLLFEQSPGSSLVRLHGPFEYNLHPNGFDTNPTPLMATFSPVLTTSSFPELLASGRTLILERDDGLVAAHKTTVRSIDAASGSLTLASIPAAAQGFTLGNTLIRGNVVKAGHGESKPVKVLGSGNAGLSGQLFVLAVKEVAHVADSAFPAGVRSALEVQVGERFWQQVASLDDSGPADAHYAVCITEEGHLSIHFGDGHHGRRLPTGNNNIKVRYRQGTGLAGNLSSLSLAKTVKPHALMEKVIQPLPARGGNDVEGVERMRENSPGNILCLERAVSLSDITHLAARHSSVWQARAFARPTGYNRHESVRLVVVPAGGGTMNGLAETLGSYLRTHLLPGVELTLSDFVPVQLDMDVTLRVDMAAYDSDVVVKKVRTALVNAFALKNAKLGKPLFRSEIARVVEGVEGVENSVSVISGETLKDRAGKTVPLRHVDYGGDGTIRGLRPAGDQVIYLEDETSALRITAEKLVL